MFDDGSRAECHVGAGLGGTMLSADPDLYALRDAAMREKEAFLDYRSHGMTIADPRLSEIFHREAREQAAHFIELNRMISRIDPTQAREFKNRDLAFLVDGAMADSRMRGSYHGGGREKDPEKWLEALKDAVDFEYHTINVYQEDATRATHPEVKELLTRIMNHEKDDLAIFIRELCRLLHHRA